MLKNEQTHIHICIHIYNYTYIHTHIHIIYITTDKQHNIRMKTIKLLEEKIGINLHNFEFDNRFFLDMTPKT